MSRFSNLPRSRPYKLGLPGAGSVRTVKRKSKLGSYHHPPSKVAVPPARLVGPVADIPVVVMIEVPVVWEVSPRGGFVAVALGAAGLVGLVGPGLVL